ncbi:possible protease [Nitrobacter sp. Nb-311A]|nr:possible protease [Nitrobacter sp. Nb-311A]
MKWATANLTYSFPTSASYYGSGYGIGEPSDNFETLNNQQQDAVRIALGMFSSVANLNYLELTETAVQHADLRFALSDAPSTAWAYLPHPAPEGGGDAWFNNSSGYYSAPVRGNYAHFTIIHEIGHAHGLDHAHEDPAVPVSRDSIEYTVMSYRSFVGASTTSSR